MGREKDPAFLRRLQQESEQWERDGLLAPGQRDRILGSYAAGKSEVPAAPPARLVVVLSLLGALLIGSGIILFVAANWQRIPNPARLTLIVAALLASYGFGFRLRYGSERNPATGNALIFVGTLVFGAGIFLVAQIYHITAHYPNGFLLWGIGVLPLALVVRSRALFSLVIVDLLIWLAMECSLRVSDTPDWGLATVTLYLMTGVLFWGAGLGLRGRQLIPELADPLVTIGTLATFSSAFILTFDIYRHRIGSDDLLFIYATVAAAFFACIVARFRSAERERYWEAELIIQTALIGGALALAIAFRGIAAETAYLPVLIANIVFAAGVVGLIVLGFLRQNSPYVNIGLVFFVLDLIARYCDIFWEMLPRSLFFIIGGVLLMGGGLALERKRRRLLAQFNVGEDVP